MFTVISFRANRPSTLTSRLQRLLSTACLFGLLFTAASNFAKAAQPVATPNPTPVSGAKPVEVVGAVDIAGEPFKQRFTITKSIWIYKGYASGYADIPLPPGKRLVIETLSIWGTLPPGSKAFSQVSIYKTNGNYLDDGKLLLPLADISPYGSTHMYSNVTSATLRFNTDVHQLRVDVFTTDTAPNGSLFDATIFGYLEDI